MAQKIVTVEDNTAPNINITLNRDGSAIDLSTASTVELFLSKDGTITNTGHTTCTVTSASTGAIIYTPQTNDFADAGTYKAEVKITYGDGSVERVYEKFNIVARTKIGT